MHYDSMANLVHLGDSSPPPSIFLGIANESLIDTGTSPTDLTYHAVNLLSFNFLHPDCPTKLKIYLMPTTRSVYDHSLHRYSHSLGSLLLYAASLIFLTFLFYSFSFSVCKGLYSLKRS